MVADLATLLYWPPLYLGLFVKDKIILTTLLCPRHINLTTPEGTRYTTIESPQS